MVPEPAGELMLAIDVVVRTLADVKRSELLFRALDSIQNQDGVNARPIVVLNGDRHDPQTVERLERRRGILLRRLPPTPAGIGSAGAARCEGRQLVTAPCFAYLDDDDELIMGSFREPVEWMYKHPECDTVISNGYFVSAGGVRSEYIHIGEHLRTGNPALSLLNDCWLAPGAFVCRTESISLRMIDSLVDHNEWTQLAFRMCAANKQLHFMDVPTVLCHDTPGSMSKDFAHEEAALDVLREVRSDPRMSAEVRAGADRKYHNFLHVLAMRSWREGNARRAWRYHLASMRPPYTLKYLLVSRKLLWPLSSSRREM